MLEESQWLIGSQDESKSYLLKIKLYQKVKLLVDVLGQALLQCQVLEVLPKLFLTTYQIIKGNHMVYSRNQESFKCVLSKF